MTNPKFIVVEKCIDCPFHTFDSEGYAYCDHEDSMGLDLHNININEIPSLCPLRKQQVVISVKVGEMK